MSWLDDVVEQHKEFESPLNFWRWAALAAISAVVKDSVWLNRQMFNLYPNIYVMFHADSGMKKGPPVNMAKRLVKAVNNTRIISGRSSIQGILKELATAEAKPGQPILKTAVAFICSSELSSSIVEDKVATTILTDLYDRSYNVGEWRSLLKMETFDLRDPTITMLTATNESHAADFFGKKDISGGYFARTFVIYERDENRSNSLLVPLVNPIDYDKLANYLRTLAKLKGEFAPLASREPSDIHKYEIQDKYSGASAYFSDAGRVYEEWYHGFKADLKKVKDPTGTLNRFGESVLKVAMLLSLAEQPELEISVSAMEEAITQCEKLVGNIRRVTVGKTGEEGSNAVRKKLLLEELMERPDHKISRAQLNRKYWIQGNINEWDETVLSFEAAGFIKIYSGEGSTIYYEMTPEAVTEMEKFFQGRNK